MYFYFFFLFYGYKEKSISIVYVFSYLKQPEIFKLQSFVRFPKVLKQASVTRGQQDRWSSESFRQVRHRAFTLLSVITSLPEMQNTLFTSSVILSFYLCHIIGANKCKPSIRILVRSITSATALNVTSDKLGESNKEIPVSIWHLDTKTCKKEIPFRNQLIINIEFKFID